MVEARTSAKTPPTVARELPDVSPCEGKYDHYQNHHQAHFCPQIVSQAFTLVVALHRHDLPSARQTNKEALMNRKEH
jgi:hypothetical protein